MLTLHVHIAGGNVAEDGLKAEFAQECRPERQKFVVVQAKRQTDGRNRICDAGRLAVALELLQLPFIKVGQVGLFGSAERTLTAVARNEAAAAAEVVDGQVAVVLADAAARRAHIVLEARENVRADERGAVLAVVLGVQRRAVSTHETRDSRAGNIAADFLLERAQDGVIEERAALYDNVLTEVVRRVRTDNLVQRVLDNRYRQTGRNRVNARAVLLRLLDRGVHEHRAARTQINGVLCEQTQLAELLDGVAHRAGKRLDERAAAGRAGFVQRNIVDTLVADFEAFDVLTADVDDEINIRAEMACRAEVRDRLDQTEIHAECVLNQCFAVAGDRRGNNMYAVAAEFVQLGELLADNVRRIALVGLVVVEQNLVVLADEHQFRGRRAAVDAEVGIALVHGDVLCHHVVCAVPSLELLVLLLILEQRRQVVGNDRSVSGLLECREQRVHGVGFLRAVGVLSRARRDGVRRKSREVRVLVVQFERLLEALLQALEEEQRTAEEQYIALDLTALGQTGNRLVDDRLEDRRGNVLFSCALVQQRLNIRLGEYAAAGSDGVDALRALCEFIEFGRGHVQQDGHLVDKRAGAARAGAVHALLQLTGEEYDLCVLAAQLNDNIGRRNVHAYRLASGEHLLNKINIRGLGHA